MESTGELEIHLTLGLSRRHPIICGQRNRVPDLVRQDGT
jgi:hypothetical protein